MAFKAAGERGRCAVASWKSASALRTAGLAPGPENRTRRREHKDEQDDNEGQVEAREQAEAGKGDGEPEDQYRQERHGDRVTGIDVQR